MPMAGESAKDLSSNGPTILNERVFPSTIELNRALQPIQKTEIVADVKDFRSEISNVKLRFLHAPFEVPMSNIGGTTWRGTLTPNQLRELAVSGKTITYEANIIAQSKDGRTAVSEKPLSVEIKTPDIAKLSG